MIKFSSKQKCLHPFIKNLSGGTKLPEGGHCIKIGKRRQLTTTVMIQSHCFYFNKQPYALELLHEKEKAIIIR